MPIVKKDDMASYQYLHHVIASLIQEMRIIFGMFMES